MKATSLITSCVLVTLALSQVFSFGQGYPKVPADIMAASTAERAAAAKLSDAAFQRALPEIEAWAKKGKPYVPGATKPKDLPQAKIPAFPGAWGGGMYSFGGRGGKVIVVTNLNDSGPGSFRDACEQGGPRIVVFNVAGIIKINAVISIRAPYITIAGHTAPGDGVCIAGNSVQIDTHDVVIRHMRFRRGKLVADDRDDALGGNPVGNIMLDHLSTSWGLDEGVSIYRHMYQPKDGSKALKLNTVNVTIQNTISSEALNTYHHSFGSTIGGLNATFHHNLWANNAGRNPSIGMGDTFNFINNVVFNWRHRTMDGGGGMIKINVINNYYKPGPGTPKTHMAYRLVKPETNRDGGHGRVYASGNVVHGNAEVTADNWAGGVQLEVDDRVTTSPEVLAGLRANEPFQHAPLPIQSAEKAYEFVLANAGATLPRRDAVDERIIKGVRTGVIPPQKIADGSVELAKLYGYAQRWTDVLAEGVEKGFITNPAEVGGYPDYKGTPYKDSDGDGLPDDWEKKHGLNPNDSADATTDLNGDGYTNIEDFINGLDPRAAKVDWADLKNNVDQRNK
jgi:pectate lyase